MQRPVRVELVGGVTIGPTPEAATAAADVPVGEVVDELEQGRDHPEQLIGLHPGVDGGDQALQPREDPAVQLADPRIGIHEVRLPAVHVGVPGEERVGVPQRQHDRAHLLEDPLLLEAQILGVDHGRVHQVDPQRVGPVLVEDEVGVREVALALRHLLAVCGEDDAVDDHVLERGAIEERGGEDGEGVEPAAGLVEALGDEVGWERALDRLLVLEGVVVLCVGHGARLEPAVEDLRDAPHGASLGPAGGEGDPVHPVPVQVGDRAGLQTRELLQLGDRPHADHVRRVLVAAPDRERRPPEAPAGDVPVTRPRQPVAEAAGAHSLGDPADGLVVADEPVPQVLDPHEPVRDRHVQERLLGPIAVRVGVDQGVLVDDAARLLQVRDDVLVGILRELALEVGHGLVEHAVDVQRVHQGQVLLDARLVVVLAERGRLVDDPGACIRADVGRGHDAERRAPALDRLRVLREVGEQRLVRSPDQLGALHAPQLLGLPHAAAGLVVREPARLDVGDLTGLDDPHADVVHLGVDREGEVAGQGPGSGGPGPQRGVLVLQREAHGQRGVLAAAVAVLLGGGVPLLRAEGHLEVGERGPQGR